MTDIVERLRQSVTKGYEPTDELAVEAADEIERLRAERLEYHDEAAILFDLIKNDPLLVERFNAALERHAPTSAEVGSSILAKVKEGK